MLTKLVQPYLTRTRIITPAKQRGASLANAGLTGFRGLAGAVVHQAFQDANAGDLKAANWLGSYQAGL